MIIFKRNLNFWLVWYEIYSKKVLDTIEIHFQGGIDAANGFSSIFMVQSVTAVPNIGKVKREHHNAARFEAGGKNSNGSFAKVLENAEEETRKSSMDCHTVTYDRDCQIRTFLYQSGEYRF